MLRGLGLGYCLRAAGHLRHCPPGRQVYTDAYGLLSNTQSRS